MIYIGKIEDCSNDPFRATRYKVRLIGVHQADKTILPTEDLPWATCVQNNSAAMSGIGTSANGYLNGSTVAVMFLDEDKQIPFILGAIGGVPNSNYTGTELYSTIDSELSILPRPVPPEEPTEDYIGPLSHNDVKNIISKLGELRGNNPSKTTEFGIGKYQHTDTELEALGYISDGTWVGKNGVKSVEQYLNTPNEQYDAEENLLKVYYVALMQMQVITAYTPKEKVAGVLLSAHVNGIEGAYTLVYKGKDYNNYLSENTLQFYREGHKLIGGIYTEEIPTIENIDNTATDNSGEDIYPSKSKFDVKPHEISLNNQGFRDPNGTYPLLSHDKEPDTPRLASGIKVTQTILGFKEQSSVNNISVANSTVTWKQSPQPYNAQYPKNHVYQSESGHVMEFDDTKDAERVHIAHRTGTFFEIDNVGNQVDRIMGIRTVIVDADELVYIKGSGHVTIDGDMSLKVNKAMHVEITGNANVKVAGDYNIDVGGTFRVNSAAFEIGGSGSSKVTAPALALNANNILQNPSTGDIIFSGHTNSYDAVSGVSQWSPSIRIPAPVTRKEMQGIELEDTEASKILAGEDKALLKVDEDKTSPAHTPSKISSIYTLPSLITYETVLSANFKVRDVSVGSLGSNFPFSGQHGLTAKDIAENAQGLCLNCLEPIRQQFSSVGFKLNSVVRPSGNPYSNPNRISQHELGMAADISFSSIRGLPNDREKFFDIAKWIKDNILFDQLLLEYRNGGSVWIHISYNKTSNRRNIMTMNNDKKYDNGLVLLKEL